MIEFLLRSSLRHRVIVLGLSVALLLGGLWTAARMPVDVFPDLSAPRVTIVTEATGMAPEEIERLITFPIETNVNGVAGVRRVRSASAAGISIVWVEFDWTTDDVVARQRVTERLSALGGLPAEAEAPLLAPPSSVMGEIAFVALQAPGLDPASLRRVADVEVRRRLVAIEGVAQVVALGGLERQYLVELDPAALQRHGLQVDAVVEALQRGNRNAPGGFVIGSGQEAVVRVLGRAHDERDLAATVIGLRSGVPVAVGDVARVRVGAAIPRGTASYNGEPAVVMSVVKQPGADTVEVTARVDAVLDDLEPSLADRDIAVRRDLFRQAEFVERAIANLERVLLDGSWLVVGVLVLFLWSLRPTLISAIALPTSLLAAVLALDALGFTLDTMTLGGLAIAIGELVDDAIVDVENVVRRLREASRLDPAQRSPVLEIVFEASREIRSSIVSATAILMVVFAPLLFLEGLEGRLLRPLAIAYLVAIASSLVVAVTITPVLCSWLLPRVAERQAGEPPLLRGLGIVYAPVLRGAMRHPWLVTLGSVAVVSVGAWELLSVQRAFLPPFNEGSLTIAAVTLPGTSLEQSDQLATLAERALLEDPAVVSTARRTGRAERDEHVQGVEASEIDVRLRPDERELYTLQADLRERLAAVPGLQFTFGQPISHRIEHMMSGQRTSLSVKVFGDDLATLREVATEVETVARSIPELVDVSAEPVVEVPQLVVRIDERAAARYGLSTGAAADLVGTVLWGRVTGRIFEENTMAEVVVRYPSEHGYDVEGIGAVTIPMPSGANVPLQAIAEVRFDVGPNVILRENVARRVSVTANVAGQAAERAYESLRAAIEARIDTPSGIRIEYAGQFERQAAATSTLLVYGAIAFVCIVVILAVTLGSLRRAAIVLVNVPLAFAGGMLGVHLGAGVLSVASMIGFITLFGIATRNGILLATRAGDLELAGVPRAEAVERAARERLAPIVMTAVTAGLGLLPLALAIGEPGSEIQAPMAMVILTGLISSTVLNMVVVPAMLGRWGGALRATPPTAGRAS